MLSRRTGRFALMVALMVGFATAAAATPTTITVKVLARGAKFIGSSMGGALVTIRDADTGELLATGVTSGGTGDTEHIMKELHPRNRVLSTEGSAGFTAVIDLDRPRRLEVTAYGPLANRASANTVSSTQWVLPGRDITGGDAWLLEMPGFAVQVLSPSTHVKLPLRRSQGGTVPIHVEANVTMMCGCPLVPGDLWNPDGCEIRASVTRDGEPYADVPLAWAGKASHFAADLEVHERGTYVVTVTVFDPATGNTGVGTTTFLVK